MTAAPLTPTSVPGVLGAHWTHPAGTTGVTVLRFPDGARAAVAVPGHAPGSRELGTLRADHLAGDIHALCLAGGSAFGLAAADGVMRVLADEGIGFPTPGGPVPIVPAAILYDLGQGASRPDAAAGASAAQAASSAPLAEGPVGAAAGGTVGKAHGNVAPGGTGCAGQRDGLWTVAAVAAVNAFGGIRDPHAGGWLAGGPVGASPLLPLGGAAGGNTTLVCVCTDAPLSKVQCQILADMATAGLARAISPAFTPFDGDTVFAVSTGSGDPVGVLDLTRLGAVAAEVVAEAIVRGVRASGGPAPAR